MGGGGLESQNEFTRLEQFAKVQVAPPVKFKDLEEVVSSRIVRNQITFDYRTDFMRITSDTNFLVPITVQIQNKQMTFRNREWSAFRVPKPFRANQHHDRPASSRLSRTSFSATSRTRFSSRRSKVSPFTRRAVPLRPGLYKIDVVIKDVNSGNVGVLNTRLAVSSMPDDKFDASSLILADQIEPVSSKDVGVGQFVLGSTKVRPKLDAEFHTDQPMGIYLQFYNLKVDDKTHKNDLSLDVKVSQGQQTVSHDVKTGEDLKQNGEQVTFEQLIAPRALPPGKYKIAIQATGSFDQTDCFPFGGFYGNASGSEQSGGGHGHWEVTSPYEVGWQDPGLDHRHRFWFWLARRRPNQGMARSPALCWNSIRYATDGRDRLAHLGRCRRAGPFSQLLSNQHGAFFTDRLKPGKYSLRVSLPGFSAGGGAARERD